MPKLDQIVSTINDRLKAGKLKGNAFQRGAFYGLTTPLTDSDGALVPTDLTTGNAIDLTISDSLTFQIYHKNTTASFSTSDPYTVSTTYQMTAVVFFNDQFVKMNTQNLAHLIRCELSKPFTKNELGQSGLSSVSMNPISANFDSYAVFGSEYPNYENKLQISEHLISLSYSITVTANCNCVDCETCD